ncbi:hypothetical protein GW937_00080 [Candidatus Kaiserbacteria bacterium]|nr:hypothetical protein [Candidatus Kaiserbacteria bacterium]
MSAKIISFAQAVKDHQQAVCDGDFQQLFVQAQELRSRVIEETENGLTVVGVHTIQAWFQKEIADEVFRKKLFSRNILSSVWYVSDLLATFAVATNQGTLCITDHVDAYVEDSNPEHLLKGANSAFLLFVFHPEHRLRRPVPYRKFAAEIGPSLYTSYAQSTGRTFGISMADAFAPLGVIARERFARLS